jgi:signal transduction histidine kinase
LGLAQLKTGLLPAILGLLLLALLIAGVVLNTIFLVREIRRNEQHDAFINAVTHELKTPVASIRLVPRNTTNAVVDEAKRNEFYRIMLEDSDRLLGHHRADSAHGGGSAFPAARLNLSEIDVGSVVQE